MIARRPAEILDACAFVALPTEAHRTLAGEFTSAMAQDPRVTAVCLTGSTARGVAAPFSDLDVVVYTSSEHRTDVVALAAGYISGPGMPSLDLDVIDGEFCPGRIEWMSTDGFELELGNYVAYARPLFERDGAFQRVQERYLPYYDATLREQRAARWREVTTNHAERARRGVDREMAFDAADRLQLGVKSFLAGLFVERQIYPIDYAKWVEYQLVDLLGHPELLPPLRALFDLGALDLGQLRDRADELQVLAEEWLRGSSG